MDGVESRVCVDAPVLDELRLADRGLKRCIGDSGTAVCGESPCVLVAR